MVCDRHPFIIFEKNKSECADNNHSMRSDLEMIEMNERFRISFVSDICKNEFKSLVDLNEIGQCLI